MIKILKAHYGNKEIDPVHFFDVKEIIEKNYIIDGIIKVGINNETMQGDPLQFVPKKLELELEYNDEIIKYLANEGEYFVFPKDKYKKENTLVLTSCNRIEQVLFAIAVNKEIIKEDFNLVVADCSTPEIDKNLAINMHRNTDPYNLINSENYNSNWNMIESYVKTVSNIKNFKMVHISPRLTKQPGEAALTCLGLTFAALIGSKYAVKLTGVCNLKYNIFSKLDEYIKDNVAATWRRTGHSDQKSSRVFLCRPDKLSMQLINAGWSNWIDEYDYVERKLEKIINETGFYNHMDMDERDILVDEGIGRSDHRKILYENLEKHNLLSSNDIWIKKFLDGDIW